MNREKLLAVSNAIALLGTLIANWLANALPINGQTTGELSDLYPNLFVPAGFTFSIWGIIYLLLLVFVVYQIIIAFRNASNAFFIRRIGWWYVVSSLANISWIIAWHYVYPLLSLIIMLILLFSLIKIYVSLFAGRSTAPKGVRRLVVPAFSIYLGWITVAIIANTTAVLVNLGWDGFGIDPAYWTILMIGVACLFAAYFTIARSDVFYALVILWALFGIYYKRSQASDSESGIIYTSLIAMILIVVAVIVQLIRQRVRAS